MAAHQQLTPAQQLEVGFRNLRFARDLETRFRRYYNDRYLFRLRVAALVAVGIFATFGVYNYFELPEPINVLAGAVQLLFICPLLGLMWWATFWPYFSQNTFPLFLAALVVAVGGLLGIMLTAHGMDIRYRYDGLLLITMYVYFLSGMVFWMACGASWIVFLLYVIGDSFTAMPTQVLAENTIYLFATNLVGMMGCYALEHSQRRSYLYTALLEDRAQRDGLTGLHNRRYMEEHLPRLWRQARREGLRVAAAFFDVDYFKAYNDTHGHLAGDDCLREVAEALRDEARRPLDLVVRYGGEEFLVVWFDLEPADILQNLTERVRMRVRELRLPHKASKVAKHITVSGGAVATIPVEEEGLEPFLACADSALYQAKVAGRDRVVTVPDMLGSGQLSGAGDEPPKRPADDMLSGASAPETSHAPLLGWEAEFRQEASLMYRMSYQMLLLTNSDAPLLVRPVAIALRTQVRDYCEANEIVISKGRVNEEKFELIVNLPRAMLMENFIDVIKGDISKALVKKFPKLLDHLPDENLWAPGYFVSTLGEEDCQAMSAYIHQDEDDGEDDFLVSD